MDYETGMHPDNAVPDPPASRSSGTRPSPAAARAMNNFWASYWNKVKPEDDAMLDSWRDDMDGLLIFAGLFSAALTAFAIESYQQLKPDPGDVTVALLAQISRQLADISAGRNNSALSAVSAERAPFSARRSSIVVNVCWFLSLALSLTCALGATMVKQWARDYEGELRCLSSPEHRMKMRSFLRDGTKAWNMDGVVDSLPALLFAAVILFFAGLVAFLAQVNSVVTALLSAALLLVASAYVYLSFSPLWSVNSPFRTPLSASILQLLRLLDWLTPTGRKELVEDRGSLVQCLSDRRASLAFNYHRGNTHGIEGHLKTRRNDQHYRIESSLLHTAVAVMNDDEMQLFVEAFPGISGAVEDEYRLQYASFIFQSEQFRGVLDYLSRATVDSNTLQFLWSLSATLTIPFICNDDLRSVDVEHSCDRQEIFDTYIVPGVCEWLFPDHPDDSVRCLQHCLRVTFYCASFQFLTSNAQRSIEEILDQFTAPSAPMERIDFGVLLSCLSSLRWHSDSALHTIGFTQAFESLRDTADDAFRLFDDYQDLPRSELPGTVPVELFSLYELMVEQDAAQAYRWDLFFHLFSTWCEGGTCQEQMSIFSRTAFYLVTGEGDCLRLSPSTVELYKVEEAISRVPSEVHARLTEFICRVLTTNGSAKLSPLVGHLISPEGFDSFDDRLPCILWQSTCSIDVIIALKKYQQHHPDGKAALAALRAATHWGFAIESRQIAGAGAGAAS